MSFATNTLPRHLVPLPMGEETLARFPVNYYDNCDGKVTLTSPLGRGVRQRGEGLGCLRKTL